MRIGRVIGKVTLNQQDAALKGGRWLVVSPITRASLQEKAADFISPTSPTVVVYDNLGAGAGDLIGFVEGAEATAPFKQEIPIDALNVAIFDHLNHTPPGGPARIITP